MRKSGAQNLETLGLATKLKKRLCVSRHHRQVPCGRPPLAGVLEPAACRNAMLWAFARIAMCIASSPGPLGS